MNKIVTLILILISTEISYAQYAYFATRGTITYDKITYTRARMRDMQQNFNQNPRGGFGGGGRTFDLENFPESTTEKYILEFDENETLMYKDLNDQSNAQPNSDRGQGFRAQGMQMGGGNRGAVRGAGGNISIGGNTIRIEGGMNARPDNSSKILHQNLKDLTTQVQIQIDEKYIITDSLNQITWRFSDEYRNIAGYECRRVNGATKDSLYLIAFYTDELPISAGPALVNGLPGMILGLIIPEMHIQYWATKVEYTNNLVKKDWKDKKVTTIPLDKFVESFGRFFQRGRDSNSSKRQIQEQLLY